MAEQYGGEVYYTPDEAAGYLKVTTRWLKDNHDVPAVVLGHKTIRYRQKDLDRYMAERVYQAPKAGRPR